MARKFCTIEEAASRLFATPDEIESMLGEGLLQEFRVGTGRFLRAADVQALVARQDRSGQIATMLPPDLDPVDEPTEEDVLAWKRERPAPSTSNTQIPGAHTSKPSAKTSRPPKRPGLRSWRLSKRQGLWAGVLDDRPTAILAVFILGVLFLGGLAAGAYFLLQKL